MSSVTLTPKRYPRIGAQHKRPHFDRPFRSTLYKAFCNGLRAGDALPLLLQTIREGNFTPFFARDEIDSLFKEEVTKKYGGGRYYRETKLDSLDKWSDLLNNTAVIAVSNRDYLRLEKNTPPEERIEVVQEMQVGLRRMKIIEDWIYYHPEALQSIVSA